MAQCCRPRWSALLISFGLMPINIFAASILVDTSESSLTDNGNCSLPEAIASANGNTGVDNCNIGQAGADTVTVLVSGTITLGSSLPILESVTVQGPGRDLLTVSGGQATPIFQVDASGATVIIADLTLSDGYSQDGLGGGAIQAPCVDLLRLEDLRITANEAVGTGTTNGPGGGVSMIPEPGCDADLEIVRAIVTDNRSAASFGGGLYLSNTNGALNSAVIEDSLFEGNTSLDGGAVWALQIPTLSIQGSRFEGNQIDTAATMNDGEGGALFLAQTSGFSGTALTLIENSSFLFNFAGRNGGAISLDGPLVTSLQNVTLTGNNVAADGPAATFADNGATLAIFFSTVFNNGSGTSDDLALSAYDGASISLDHSIVATNWTTTANCTASAGGQLQSNGYVIDSGQSCTGHVSDLANTDPDLRSRSDHPVAGTPADQAIFVPADESPAIDGGANQDCPGPLGSTTTLDQRGETRPVAGPTRGSIPCDIGAVEFQPADQPLLFQDRFEGT